MDFSIVTRLVHKVGAKAYAHRADIAFVGGAAAVIAGTVMTAKGAVKNEEVKAKHTARMEEIKKEEEYKTPEEIKQEKSKICRESAKGYVKNYGPGIATELSGLALFAASRKWRNDDTKYWSDVAVGALGALEAIKAKIEKEEGADKAAHYFNGVSVESMDEIDMETGEVTGEKKEVIFEDNPDMYSFLFYEPNINWRPQKGANQAFVNGIYESLKLKQQQIGFIKYHDIQLAFGVDPKELSEATAKAAVPYIRNDGTINVLDLGLDDPDEATQRFKQGLEPSVLIKVKNVVPNIYTYYDR